MEHADEAARARPSEDLGLSIAAKTDDARLSTLEDVRMYIVSSPESTFKLKSPAGSASVERIMVFCRLFLVSDTYEVVVVG